ncbi:MAG TPA: hypothetical protein VJ917_05680, partial [Saprospiraceae bacterium]|nr:hypothetical protein [Saprospiraceae bacterium]
MKVISNAITHLRSLFLTFLSFFIFFSFQNTVSAQCGCAVDITGGVEPVPMIIVLDNAGNGVLTDAALSNEIAPAGGCGYFPVPPSFEFLVFDTPPSDLDTEPVDVRNVDCTNVGAGAVTFYVSLQDNNSGDLTIYEEGCDGEIVEVTVTVQDNSEPTLINPANDCASLEPSFNMEDCDQGEMAILADLEAAVAALYEDNCGTVNVTANTSLDFPTTGDCDVTTTVNLTIDDGNGNSTTCDVDVTVIDDNIPTWTFSPSDITINTQNTSNGTSTGTSGLFVVVELDCDDPDLNSKLDYLRNSWLPNSVDDCGTPTVTEVVDQQLAGPFTCPEIDRYTVVWQSTDECGNVTTGTDRFRLRIEIHDNTSPIFAAPPVNPPANITLTADPGVCSVDLTASSLLEVTAEDCDNITYSYTVTGALSTTGSDNNANEVYPVGVSTITYEAEDACNAASSYVITLTVEDNEAPVIND